MPTLATDDGRLLFGDDRLEDPASDLPHPERVAGGAATEPPAGDRAALRNRLEDAASAIARLSDHAALR